MLHTGHSMVDNMIKYYSFFLIFISIFVVSCAEIRHRQDLTEIIDYKSSVGWLHGRCLAIKNSNILKGSQLTIVQLDEPQKISSATALSITIDGEKCFALSKDRQKVNIDSGYSFYLINSDSDINLGIAIVDNAINVEKYDFDYCTTTEGVLYSLKKLNNMNSEDLWNGYYYLGYDSEATCDDKSNE